MFHGHCVGVGCVAAAKISARRGLISEEEVRDIRDTMLQFSIPVAGDGLETGEVIRATLNDKKMDAGVVKFVLLNEIGKAYVDRTVTEAEMKAGLEYIMETKE